MPSSVYVVERTDIQASIDSLHPAFRQSQTSIDSIHTTFEGALGAAESLTTQITEEESESSDVPKIDQQPGHYAATIPLHTDTHERSVVTVKRHLLWGPNEWEGGEKEN
ncbi:hypothetical protein H2203_002536 [Taxawa tesnikishii (nom. ined.)]|nr:hypothetical protein H2203_002536 [Dothideales sp. JES 119]